MLLSQLQVVTGQVATSLSEFAMHGHIADSASAKAAVTIRLFWYVLQHGANGQGLPSGCRRLCQQEEQMGMLALLQSQPWLALLRLGFHQTCTTAAETYGPHMGCIWATYGDLVCNIWKESAKRETYISPLYHLVYQP